ncbi:MAG: 4Fe-4S dicluster domain-containing protein [Treponema sp.]|nr:4Fe-4S dicluster domain-containing protein [Treponema sp.]
MQDKLIKRAEELLAEGKVQKVLGWKKGLFDEDITPYVFSSIEELKKDFVFNKYCAANLSKYLVEITREIEIKKSTARMNNTMAKQKDPSATEAPIPSQVVLVFLKPNDTYSFTQLLKENRISKDDVYAVAVPCQDTLDGGEPCDNCKNKKPVSCDESIGFDEEKLMGESKRMEEVKKLEKMTADERNAFWKNEFSRCIRCNACRNVCPACTCEKCVFDNNALYTSQKVAVTSFEESLFHIIRAWHVAGRCTDCGECSRVCPQGIPLHLLNRKFIKDINSIYGEYQAGADMESKPVMWTFKEDDPETSIITDRQEGGND